MANERASCGNHVELARTTDYRITRCACGTVHLHMSKGGVTVQLSDTSLAELVNVATAAQRKVESMVVDPTRTHVSPTN